MTSRSGVRRGLAVGFVLVLFLAAAVPAPALAGDSGPSGRFEPAACTFPGTQQFAPDAIKCGYLVVPERHSAPDGATIRLGVAILKRTQPGAARSDAGPTPQAEESTDPRPSPLVMAQGGPGGSTLDSFLPLFSSGALSSLLEDRDVVLFDQRGTLYSEPALLCTESISLTEQTIEQHLTREESVRLDLEALHKCRERLAASGIDLAAYNSLENAADIEALRTALGYDQINLYGVSYGTLLALQTMRLYPGALRTVVLDGVLPPQINFLTQAPQAHMRSFGELFRACSAEPACAAASPDLEGETFRLVDRLNAYPARVPITDPETGKQYNAVLDGDTFLDLLIQFFYATPLIPLLPAVIHGAGKGDFALIQRVWPVLAFDRTQAEGMYFSTVCAEDAVVAPGDVDLSGLPPQLAVSEQVGAESIVQACKDWNVPSLGPGVNKAVVSDVPVLLLNGQYDPITPPAYGQAAAQSLQNSVLFTFPGLGHGALPDDGCAQEIVREFLYNPAAKPASSCIAGEKPAAFATPANTLITPVVGRLLARIERGELRYFLPLCLALGLLLTAFVLWPFSWFVRRMQHTPPERRLVARLAPWLVVATAILGMGLIAGLAGLVIDVSLQGRDISLWIGVPAHWMWLFAVPPLICLLAAGMLVVTVLGWHYRYWGSGRRAYYTALTVAALGLVVSLAATGLLFPLLFRVG